MQKIKKTLVFIVFSLMFFIFYAALSKLIGGLTPYTRQLTTEFPICIIFSGLIYLSLKPSKYNLFLAYTPLFIFYIGLDLYYIFFGEVLRLVSLNELPELLMILNIYEISLLSLFSLSIILVFIKQINWKTAHYLLFSTGFIATLLFVSIYHPYSYISLFTSLSKGIINTKADRNVKYNGKLATLLYEEAKRQRTINSLQAVDLTPTLKSSNKRTEFIKENLHRPIFIYQLESFLDPMEFKSLQLKDGFNNKFFQDISDYKGYVTSPVFGGHTAQAEFEVLCMAPALAKFSDIEFNNFTGKPTDCLTNWISDAGLPTTANIAFSPTYFNALKAYETLGFKHIRYPEKYGETQMYPIKEKLCGNEKHIQDKNLFDQSLTFFTEHIKGASLNYSMGMYGHWPHYIDKTCYDDYIELDGQHASHALERSINQYRYRTQSIADFIPRIFSEVPDALVLIISDHLPPMTDSKDTYQDLEYHNQAKKHPKTNIFYVFEKGKVLDMSKRLNMHHYQIGDLLLNVATEGKWCEEFNCSFGKSANNKSLYKRYLSITKLATK